MSETDTTVPDARLGRRSFLRRLGAVIGGIGVGAWNLPVANAATCRIWEGEVCYTQSNHSCGSHCGSGLFPDDKWTKYIHDDTTADYHDCGCMYVGCLGKYRCNGSASSYPWMRQIGYTYCCDVCS